jgi:glycosyltransferase involved in cell wall biosynthesis
LDHFVSKYRGGHPPERYGGRPRNVHVIPNGVALAPVRPLAAPKVRPPQVDARFALVTCCRIAPNKMLESVVDVMTHLSTLLPAASLTIVGGVDQRHVGYFDHVRHLIDERRLTNMHFAGPCADVFGFLDQFKVFLMLSKNQGCPNASLEALAMGLPVVANPDGGTPEQVLHGQTGFLVDAAKPAEVAAQLVSLLHHEDLARRLGEAAREHVRRNFALEKMAAAYRELLER